MQRLQPYTLHLATLHLAPCTLAILVTHFTQKFQRKHSYSALPFCLPVTEAW